MGYHIGEHLQADILGTAVERGHVWLASGEWRVEHVATCEKPVHPLAAEGGRHNGFGECNAIGISDRGGFRDALGGLGVG